MVVLWGFRHTDTLSSAATSHDVFTVHCTIAVYLPLVQTNYAGLLLVQTNYASLWSSLWSPSGLPLVQTNYRP